MCPPDYNPGMGGGYDPYGLPTSEMYNRNAPTEGPHPPLRSSGPTVITNIGSIGNTLQGDNYGTIHQGGGRSREESQSPRRQRPDHSPHDQYPGTSAPHSPSSPRRPEHPSYGDASAHGYGREAPRPYYSESSNPHPTIRPGPIPSFPQPVDFAPHPPQRRNAFGPDQGSYHYRDSDQSAPPRADSQQRAFYVNPNPHGPQPPTNYTQRQFSESPVASRQSTQVYHTEPVNSYASHRNYPSNPPPFSAPAGTYSSNPWSPMTPQHPHSKSVPTSPGDYALDMEALRRALPTRTDTASTTSSGNTVTQGDFRSASPVEMSKSEGKRRASDTSRHRDHTHRSERRNDVHRTKPAHSTRHTVTHDEGRSAPRTYDRRRHQPTALAPSLSRSDPVNYLSDSSESSIPGLGDDDESDESDDFSHESYGSGYGVGLGLLNKEKMSRKEAETAAYGVDGEIEEPPPPYVRHGPLSATAKDADIDHVDVARHAAHAAQFGRERAVPTRHDPASASAGAPRRRDGDDGKLDSWGTETSVSRSASSCSHSCASSGCGGKDGQHAQGAIPIKEAKRKGRKREKIKNFLGLGASNDD